MTTHATPNTIAIIPATGTASNRINPKSEFNVDYIWLTTGDGEMFVDTDDDFIERIDRIMVGEDDARKNLFKALLEASDEDIAAFQRIIDLFASKKD